MYIHYSYNISTCRKVCHLICINVSILNKTGPVVLEKKRKKFQCIFTLSLLSPFGKAQSPSLNKFQSPSPKITLCQIWPCGIREDEKCEKWTTMTRQCQWHLWTNFDQISSPEPLAKASQQVHELTHGNIWEFVCGSMWIYTIQMWTSRINPSKHQRSTNVTLVPNINTNKVSKEKQN